MHVKTPDVPNMCGEADGGEPEAGTRIVSGGGGGSVGLYSLYSSSQEHR
jgi:hypothetical protein